MATTEIKLIIASRSGIMSPTVFVQQINTLSSLIPGRVSLNIVAGHSPDEQKFYGDFLAHDDRYARTEEFLTICRRLWAPSGNGTDFSGRYYRVEKATLKTPFNGLVPDGCSEKPEIFIAGSSNQARSLTSAVGDTWVTLAEDPGQLQEAIQHMRQQQREVALRLSVICRSTTAEAHAVAKKMQAMTHDDKTEKKFVSQSDSIGIKRAYGGALNNESPWLTDCLWRGAVPTHGAPAIALVGDPEAVTAGIMQYKDLGVSQFIFSGWPQYEEMCLFCENVLPLIRQRER
jgi:alkanesulfonate monooxygenase